MEEQIAQKLITNIPTEPHIPAPIVAEETQPNALDSNVELGIDYGVKLADYFDVSRVDRYNETTQRQLQSIYEWAVDAVGSQELDKVLHAIRSLELELGASFTPDRLQRMAKYVHLQQQSRVLSIQMEALHA